ncbi:hypothetical protein ACFLTQ_03035, partial [Chloroflexota bacterium]
MTRIAGAEIIYELADLFRKRCLIEGRSLLWPEYEVWTAENLSALWAAFINNPDLGDRSFFDKWKDQLKDQPEDIHRIAADIIVLYNLFPANIRQDTKMGNLKQ